MIGSTAGAARSLCVPYLRDLPVGGVSISVGGRVDVQSIVASSDPVAQRLEALQFELGEGPTVDVLHLGGRSLAFDLREQVFSELWPVFTVAAIAAGAGALLAFPMLTGAIGVGAVSLYCSRAGPPWPEPLLRSAARLVASTVRPAVILATDTAGSDATPSGGGAELRRAVHQAGGMVSVQASCSIEEAAVLLRARAFADSRTVEAVARDVVARALSFRPADD